MTDDATKATGPRKGKKAQRSPRQKSLSRGTQYVVIRGVCYLVERLPFRVARGLGWLAGTLGYYFTRRERIIAVTSLTRVYGGERSPREIRGMARDAFRSLVTTFLEFLVLRRWPPERLLATFPEAIDGIRGMCDDLQKDDRGTSGVTAHYGNWELLSFLVGVIRPGFLCSVAKRSKYPKTHALVHQLRTSSGSDVLYTDESARKYLQTLRDGRMLGFLPDQDVRTNAGVFVDFLDLPAHTTSFPVALARKAGAKMIFCALIRHGKGFRFHYSGHWDAPQTDNDERDLVEGTQRWTRELEKVIREDPGQWLWMYPRWRSSLDRPRSHVKAKEKGQRDRIIR